LPSNVLRHRTIVSRHSPENVIKSEIPVAPKNDGIVRFAPAKLFVVSTHRLAEGLYEITGNAGHGLRSRLEEGVDDAAHVVT
jgi:hypothetical protein